MQEITQSTHHVTFRLDFSVSKIMKISTSCTILGWAWHVGVSLVESSSSFHQSGDHRSRVNRMHKRGAPREGHPMGPALGPLGVDPGRIGGGVTSRGGAGNKGGDGIIFAESPLAPGIPVVYRTPEQRISNPDRLNLDRRHLTMCPILEVQ